MDQKRKEFFYDCLAVLAIGIIVGTIFGMTPVICHFSSTIPLWKQFFMFAIPMGIVGIILGIAGRNASSLLG